MSKTPKWQDPAPISVYKLSPSLPDPIDQDDCGIHGIHSVVWRGEDLAWN